MPDTLGHQVKSLMSFIDYSLYCANENGASTNASANQDNWDNCLPTITCRVADREWITYRNYYFQLKDKYYTLMRNASCGTSCQIGQPLTSPLPGAAPIIADFNLVADTAVAACTGYQAVIVNHGGGSLTQATTVNLYCPGCAPTAVTFNAGDSQHIVCIANNIPFRFHQYPERRSEYASVIPSCL